jgi:hypothetical protein
MRSTQRRLLERRERLLLLRAAERPRRDAPLRDLFARVLRPALLRVRDAGLRFAAPRFDVLRFAVLRFAAPRFDAPARRVVERPVLFFADVRLRPPPVAERFLLPPRFFAEPRFAPPVSLLTVAQPMRSASASDPPRERTLFSMWLAIRFCLLL